MLIEHSFSNDINDFPLKREDQSIVRMTHFPIKNIAKLLFIWQVVQCFRYPAPLLKFRGFSIASYSRLPSPLAALFVQSYLESYSYKLILIDWYIAC
jgi:hypothetical protein